MYDIIVGRDEEDRKLYGDQGMFLLGRHYVKMGQVTSLSNDVHMDVGKSHIVFVCGKRGSGKSYTLGNMAEGMITLPTEIAENLSVILLDTMGIYWTMKYENKKDAELLTEWGLEPKGVNVKIFTPIGFHKAFKEKGIPSDAAFAIKPNELNSTDWCTILGIALTDPLGVVIDRTINRLRKSGREFSIEDIINSINQDERAEQSVKYAAENRFLNVAEWGLFDAKGTPFDELAVGGQISVIDVSCYSSMAGNWNIKSLVVGLIAQKMFDSRMVARKQEEFDEIYRTIHFLSARDFREKKALPLIWLMIDEAHEFLPRDGSTMATPALLTILREGRQPGLSMVLASQQPGKIHTDVMTQADIVVAHRITAKIDIDALGTLMQSYLRTGLDKMIDDLPRVKGSAIIFDDGNERMYTIQVRPRITWHGGSSPSPIFQKKKIFQF